MDLNITSEMSPEQVLVNAHEGTAVPAVLIVFISTVAIFAILGNILRSKGVKSYNKIIFFCFLISALVAVFVMLSPNSVQWIAEFFGNLSR